MDSHSLMQLYPQRKVVDQAKYLKSVHHKFQYLLLNIPYSLTLRLVLHEGMDGPYVQKLSETAVMKRPDYQ